MTVKEMRTKAEDDLRREIASAEKEMWKLRFQQGSEKAGDPNKIRRLRKDSVLLWRAQACCLSGRLLRALGILDDFFKSHVCSILLTCCMRLFQKPTKTIYAQRRNYVESSRRAKRP